MSKLTVLAAQTASSAKSDVEFFVFMLILVILIPLQFSVTLPKGQQAKAQIWGLANKYSTRSMKLWSVMERPVDETSRLLQWSLIATISPSWNG